MRLVPGLLLVWAWFGLMSEEFFARDWLRAHPLAYIASHMAIVPLIDWYVSSFDWLVAGVPAPPALGWFLAVTFLNGLVVEVGRKIRAPQDEEPGVETYTAMWGRRGATAVWTGAIACNVALATIAAAHVGFARVDAGRVRRARARRGGCGVAFLRSLRAGSGRRIEAMTGAWTLGSYLFLGIVPLGVHVLRDRSATLARPRHPLPRRRRAADRAHTGGKAAGLARLRDAGCDVPPWFVVTPDCDADDARRARRSARRASTHRPDVSPTEHRRHVILRLSKGAPRPSRCARRPWSKTAQHASYAGQFAAFCSSRATACWMRSAACAPRRSGSACARTPAPLARGEIAMAVVVQRMVEGEASGVAFGVDPVDGSDVVVVTAAYGLASGVVDGEAHDRHVARRARRHDRVAHDRRQGPHARARAGLRNDRRRRRRRKARAARARRAQVRAVASLARRIANAAGGPQDVEFTFAGGALWALQARPVTAIAAAPRRSRSGTTATSPRATAASSAR